MSAQLFLASTSPRRHEILRALGLSFSVIRVSTDERSRPEESAPEMVLRLAEAKAEAAGQGDIVLAADTVVVLEDRILGKPGSAEEAVEMLLALSGRSHTVMTGVALKTSAETLTVLSSTEVHFRQIDRDEAYRYWHSGEPCDKAGAYGIQGLGGMFVRKIEGSYSGVMGLPVFETVELLRMAGINMLEHQE